MEILNLFLFGFIVYAALILIPGVVDEFKAQHQ